jgi:hypothetical protein
MAKTVSGAFAEFRRNCVDLDAGEVSAARRSRDYLQQQIASLTARYGAFPRLDPNSSPSVASGSFARRTKIRPLDDIDFFVVLERRGIRQRQSWWDQWRYYLTPKHAEPTVLAELTNKDGHISSTRVLNLLKSALAAAPNYASADIHRNGEAVSLKLSSYPWVFDIVPAVPHVNWWTGRVDWFLMPNGKGDWMRADPRRDAARATEANQRHNGLLLPLIRLVKYWNTNRLRQGLSSYYVETLCFNVFNNRSALTSLSAGLDTFFRKAPAQVSSPCPDPKGLEPRLDRNLNRETKDWVRQAMREAARAAREARKAEKRGDVAGAFESWRRIFGPEFPRFGS